MYVYMFSKPIVLRFVYSEVHMQTFLYCIVMDGQFPHAENPQGVGDGWKGSQWSWMAQWIGK